jgi:hypothetical protein
MKTKMLTYFLMILAALSLVSCEKNPITRLQDPVPDGALNAWSGILRVYDDDLRTGGNVEFIPSDLSPPDNTMTIDFKVTEQNPPEGVNCLKYTWNGNDIFWNSPFAPANGLEHSFGGVTLIVATHFSLYDSTPAKDLRPGGYTHVSFKAKAVIDNDTTVKFEGPVGESAKTHDFVRVNSTQISDTDWTDYQFPVSQNDLSQVKDYFKIVIEYQKGVSGPAGVGGVVYVDDIRYER